MGRYIVLSEDSTGPARYGRTNKTTDKEAKTAPPNNGKKEQEHSYAIDVVASWVGRYIVLYIILFTGMVDLSEVVVLGSPGSGIASLSLVFL